MELYQSTELKAGCRTEINNLLLFSTGKLVSIFGTSIYTFAMGLYVLKLTGSGLSFAAAIVLSIIPAIVINPFAGVIADRFDKKRMVISMDLLNGLLLMAVYFLSLYYGLSIPVIYATTFILTAFTTFFGVSLEAAKPNLVTVKRLMDINSISKIIDSVSSILGPMLGGVVFILVDVRLFIIANSISFIFSAVCEIFMDFGFNRSLSGESAKVKVNFLADIKDGFKYLASKKDISGLFMILIALNFFLGFSVTVPLPFIINNVLKLDPSEFGIIEASFPAGLIIGALVVKKVHERIPYIKLLKYLSFIMSLCMVVIGIPVMFINAGFSHMTYLIYYSISAAVFGVSISFVDIPIAYIMQKTIPDEYRGRVTSIGISIGKTMLPIALIISGGLLNTVPAYFMPVAGGAVFLIFNIVSIKNINSSQMF